jgi:hypothetical protein
MFATINIFNNSKYFALTVNVFNQNTLFLKRVIIGVFICGKGLSFFIFEKNAGNLDDNQQFL